MFGELKSVIERAAIPPALRVGLLVTVRAMAWLAWAFVGVGVLLSKEYFPYWMGFVLVFETILFVALFYMLLLLIRLSLGSDMAKPLLESTKGVAPAEA